ncbi:hypothetical protein [Bradyrhizobium centrolobii]|uniref:hypothetical protein n=1 Tax=Bradyrhizobium centrolobii TaxID=1505087 RepID=UPI00322213A9
MEQALQELASAKEYRARVEAALYEQLVSFDALSVAELDCRRHLVLDRLAAKIDSTRQTIDDGQRAQAQAEAAVSEKRAHWTKCSTATHKWEQIERDVMRAADTDSEVAAEMEADDEVVLRSRGFRPQLAGASI